MLVPNTGILLGNLRRILKDNVLDTLPSGAPQRQLKAALHLLGRLEKSWDVMPFYLQADNSDVEAVLAALDRDWPEPGNAPTNLGERLFSPPSSTLPEGINSPELAKLVNRNLFLQELLVEVQTRLQEMAAEPGVMLQIARLEKLYRRMAARQLVLVGDGPVTAQSFVVDEL